MEYVVWNMWYGVWGVEYGVRKLSIQVYIYSERAQRDLSVLVLSWVCWVSLLCCLFDLACFFLPSFSSH